ncbi:MAG: GTP 3',8-cyclase [Desulfovibrio sp.]
MAVRGVLWERCGESGATGKFGELGKPGKPGDVVRCLLCSHYCRIPDGRYGRCRVRGNRAGVLYSLSSDRITAANADPVEKKPLYHFLPGTTTFSLGSLGCNMTCAFCQNYAISQVSPSPLKNCRDSLPPELPHDIVAAAVTAACASVSFTYNEPALSVELIEAVAPVALENGVETVMVSNGFFSREAMRRLAPLVRAANFDLKAFSDEFYANLCGAKLTPVLRTLAQAVSSGWWVELTTLLIPGRNDSDAELTALARFIKEDLGPDVPWHVSRFRPMYKMPDVPPTPVASLERARAIGLAEGVRFVYTGNVAGHDGENTYCPDCGALFIRRAGYAVSPPERSSCSRCGAVIPGVWVQ